MADGGSSAGDVVAFEVRTGGEVHVYGGVIRSIVSGGDTGSTVNGARANGTGTEIHIHGTGIDVISTPANNIAALIAEGGAMIHANASAYNLSTGAGGTISRIINTGGHVHAPYLWEEHATPPNITSQDGADIAVVTTPGGTPKMVIYSTACASRWFDVGANACRP